MFAAKLKRLALPLFLAGAFMIFSQLASTVQAMCVYNQANIPVAVTFTCGAFCFNNWETSPNGTYCRGGEAGLIQADVLYQADVVTHARIAMDVDAHGYVVIFQPSSDRIQFCAYHADDSLAGCQAYNPDTGDVY